MLVIISLIIVQLMVFYMPRSSCHMDLGIMPQQKHDTDWIFSLVKHKYNLEKSTKAAFKVIQPNKLSFCILLGKNSYGLKSF